MGKPLNTRAQHIKGRPARITSPYGSAKQSLEPPEILHPCYKPLCHYHPYRCYYYHDYYNSSFNEPFYTPLLIQSSLLLSDPRALFLEILSRRWSPTDSRTPWHSRHAKKSPNLTYYRAATYVPKRESPAPIKGLRAKRNPGPIIARKSPKVDTVIIGKRDVNPALTAVNFSFLL